MSLTYTILKKTYFVVLSFVIFFKKFIIDIIITFLMGIVDFVIYEKHKPFIESFFNILNDDLEYRTKVLIIISSFIHLSKDKRYLYEVMLCANGRPKRYQKGVFIKEYTTQEIVAIVKNIQINSLNQ